MKAIALFLGWFVLVVLGLIFLFILTVVAVAAFGELKDRVKDKLKK